METQKPKKKKRKCDSAPYDILAADGYPDAIVADVEQKLVDSLTKNNETFKELHASVNALAHATLLGKVSTRLANSVAYQYNLLMMLLIKVREHETPTAELDVRFFDREFAMKLTAAEMDEIMKESDTTRKILIVNNYIREKMDVNAEVVSELPQEDAGFRKLLKRIDDAANKPTIPDRIDDEGLELVGDDETVEGEEITYDDSDEI